MTFKGFLELVEPKTSISVTFPFLIGLFYVIYNFNHVNWLNTIVFLLAAFSFHLFVNIHDNYQDYKNANEDAEHWKKNTNAIGVNNLSMNGLKIFMIILVGFSTLCGIWLVYRTGWILLIIGIFCFAVGYFYAAGPRPISSTPWGEFFSGFTMGFGICIIAVYINIAHTPVSFNWDLCWRVFLASGICTFAISNLLLANNIADEEEDKILQRKTIVYYLGRKNSSRLFIIHYIAGYACLVASVGLGNLPKLSLLVLLSIPIVAKNSDTFLKRPVKKETFVMAIKNLVTLATFSIIFMGLGTILHF